jgi:hypothetical protein
MKLIRIIKDFIAKAKQEAQRDYHLSPRVNTISSAQDTEENEYARKAWIGIDLDGTLARADNNLDKRIGDPVPKMVMRLNHLIQEGFRIKIFTARASEPAEIILVKKWLTENGLPDLEVTNIKDYGMLLLYDDRAIQVITNTGEIVENDKEAI